MKKEKSNIGRIFKVLIFIITIILSAIISLFTTAITQSRDVSCYLIKDNDTYIQAPAKYDSSLEYYEKTYYTYYAEVTENKVEDYGTYYVKINDDYKKATDLYKDMDLSRVYYTENKAVYYTSVVPDTSMNLFSKENFENTVQSLEFWLNTLMVAFAAICIFYSFYDIVRDKKVKSTKFTEAENKYNDKLKHKDNDSFNKFAKEVNFNRKKEAFKGYIYKELNKIEVKLNKIPDYKQQGNKKYEKLLSKKSDLEVKLTDEWINANLMKVPANCLFAKIRYPEMKTSNYIDSTISGVARYKEDSKEKELKAGKGFLKTFNGVLGGMLSGALLIIKITFDFNVTGIIICAITIVINVCWNMASSAKFASKVYENELLSPLEYKLEMLGDYEKWLLDNPLIISQHRREIEMKAIEEVKKDAYNDVRNAYEAKLKEAEEQTNES